MTKRSLLAIAVVTVMALTIVSGAGMMTATPAKAYTTATKVGDLVYLPGDYYPGSVDVGDVYAWNDAENIHIKYVIAQNPEHPWSSSSLGIQSVSIQAAWTYVATAANGEGIPQDSYGADFSLFVPPNGDSHMQSNYVSEYEVALPNTWAAGATVDICGGIAVWVTHVDGRQASIGVWACVDTGSAFNFVSPAKYLAYLTYTITASVEEHTVLEKISDLQTSTTQATFTNAKNHKAFDSKLDVIYKLVDEGTPTSYALAMDKIQSDLIGKTDGVAPDWVTPTYQQDIYAKLQTLYDDIGKLPIS